MSKNIRNKTNFIPSFEISLVVTIESAVFWDIKPCILVYAYKCFRETCCFRSQGRSALYSGEETPIFIRCEGAWPPRALLQATVTKIIFPQLGMEPRFSARHSFNHSAYVDTLGVHYLCTNSITVS
jgi:hypothetical protein